MLRGLTLSCLMMVNIVFGTDITLQTCISSFDIHKDKIIRTQDSRSMGAEFITEIDLDSREQCLRLCCETENCDVFVYEEKNAGSCYLFRCGPPEDFKCKFTHHVNYTSAILSVNRHLPDLESQIKLTKHEQDLTKLRKQEIVQQSVNAQVPENKATPSTTTTTTTATKEIIVEPKTKPPESGRKCMRNQFECRSNGECIAIYNACDGIVQCADGSDEAADLGCPSDSLPTSSPVHSNSAAGSAPGFIPIESNVKQPQQNYPSSNVQAQNVYRSSTIQHVDVPQKLQQQQQPQQEADFIRPSESRIPPIDQRPLQYETPPLPAFSQYGQQAMQQSAWIPHQSNQMPQPLSNYVDKNSHIFNHKESGLQVSDGQEPSPVQYGEMNPRDYPKLPNYYGDSYRQNLQPIQEHNWPAKGQEESYNPGYSNQIANLENRDNWHPNAPELPPQNYQQPKPQLSSGWKPEPQLPNPKHEQEKMAHELKEHSKLHQETKLREEQTKTIKIEKHIVRNPHDHEVRYTVAEKFKMEEEEILDGIAETPGGAILSLTLGVILTCVMAILIGCRLRVVKRRMRRNGKSYAHDADYLVNGMYL